MPKAATKAVTKAVTKAAPKTLAVVKPRGRNKGVTKSGQLVLLRELYKAMPESQWARVLESQPTGSAGANLLRVLLDPAFGDCSIERKCAIAEVEFRDLVRMVSEHSLGAGIIQSAQQVPEIVAGIAEDARSRTFVCDLCLDQRLDGATRTTISVQHPRDATQMLEVECPKCGGDGRTRRGGDARARETFLKLHGGLEEAPAAQVTTNVQVNFGSQHSASVQRGQQLLAEGRRTVSPAPPSSQTVPVQVTSRG